MSDLHPTVLLVSKDTSYSQKAIQDLQEAGYPFMFWKELESVERVMLLSPLLILLDCMEQRSFCTQFCRTLRSKEYRLPIILLLDQDTVEDRAFCFNAGADDYLLKPYSRSAFLHRLQLYLKPKTTNTDQLQYNDLILDLSTHRALRQDQSIELTMKEFELLKYLMNHPDEVLTRDQILENVWGYDFQGESNVIEVYIRYLRLKIEHEGHKRIIQTVRGVGYVLREQ